MKKFAIAAVAAAGLLTLGACNKADNNPAAQNLESAADNMDALADNAVTDNGEATLENQADNLHSMADNAADAADNGATSNPATATRANFFMGELLKREGRRHVDGNRRSPRRAPP